MHLQWTAEWSKNKSLVSVRTDGSRKSSNLGANVITVMCFSPRSGADLQLKKKKLGRNPNNQIKRRKEEIMLILLFNKFHFLWYLHAGVVCIRFTL